MRPFVRISPSGKSSCRPHIHPAAIADPANTITRRMPIALCVCFFIKLLLQFLLSDISFAASDRDELTDSGHRRAEGPQQEGVKLFL
jgi:hypothetical protein